MVEAEVLLKAAIAGKWTVKQFEELKKCMIKRLAEVKVDEVAFRVHQELITTLLYMSTITFANRMIPYVHNAGNLLRWFTACLQTYNFEKISKLLQVKLREADILEDRRKDAFQQSDQEIQKWAAQRNLNITSREIDGPSST